MSKVRELVDSLIKYRGYQGGPTPVLYTGRDTSPECAVHLANAIYEYTGEYGEYGWVYWNGSGADTEPPIYVPRDVDLDSLCQLCGSMATDLVLGEVGYTDIPGTDGILYVDRASNEGVMLVGIREDYESLLEEDDEPYVPPVDKNVSKYKDYSTDDLVQMCLDHDIHVMPDIDVRIVRMRAILALRQNNIID